MDAEVDAAKARLRQLLRQRRRALEPDQRADRGRRITAHVLAVADVAAPGVNQVACTWSLPTEPPTDDLIADLQDRGIVVLTPRVLDQGQMEWLCTEPGDRLTLGAHGIRTTTSDRTGRLADCQAIVLPALAIDRAGVRLGQGGGYFDRALRDLPAHANGGPLRVALVYADEVVEHVPRLGHDQSVDLVVTEVGVTWLGSG